MEAGLVEGWDTAVLNQSPGRRQRGKVHKQDRVGHISWVKGKQAMQQVVTSGGWRYCTIMLDRTMTE